MAITDKLNIAQNTQDSMAAVFELRDELESFYSAACKTKVRVSEIASGAKFTNVDSEIKQVSSALISILNQAVAGMQNHEDFLYWKQSSE